MHPPKFNPICLTVVSVLIAAPLCAAETAIDFHIAGQSLADALLEFSQASGIKIFFSSDMAKNIQTGGLNGKYTPQQALQKLLDNSGLQSRYTGSNTVTIENAAAKVEPSSKANTLPPVTVTGKANRDVTDPYNQDYVLPNATVGTKTDTPVMETPLNVQVISKQVMKDQQVITLGDALKNVSGVTVNAQGSLSGAGSNNAGTSTNITLRGFTVHHKVKATGFQPVSFS